MLLWKLENCCKRWIKTQENTRCFQIEERELSFKKIMFNAWILRKNLLVKKNKNKHGLIFHYHIRAYTLLGIFMLMSYGYHVDVKHV